MAPSRLRLLAILVGALAVGGVLILSSGDDQTTGGAVEELVGGSTTCSSPSTPLPAATATAGHGLFVFDGPESQTVQALANGRFTPPVDLVGVDPVEGHVEFLAFVDINADDQPEVIMGGLGTGAFQAVILEFDGCSLNPVVGTDPDRGIAEKDTFRLLVGISGSNCAPTGCLVVSRCVGADLVSTVLSPARSYPVDADPNEVELKLQTTRFHLEAGVMQLLATETSLYQGIDQLPDDAPTPEENRQVLCE